MKYIVAVIPLLFSFYFVSGQNSSTLYQTYNKNHLYYASLNKSEARVYKMGKYFDKAGTGYSIISTDTLKIQPDSSYVGREIKIIKRYSKFYLVTDQGKKRRYAIDSIKDIENANQNLNNAYYLDKYFKMSNELNRSFPLSHHSFRNGFYTWNNLDKKDLDHLLFREFADKKISDILDSLSLQQQQYIARTNYILNNLRSLEYNSLKDSLTKLPPEYKSTSWYYGIVINEVTKQRTKDFFRLAEDFPHVRSLIFNTVEDDKEVVKELQAVEGNNEIKKEFVKNRRFKKTLPYRVIGTYAIIGGLLTWLILSQN